MTLLWFNHYGLTTNKFSMDIARTLSKRNRFSMGRCAKFVGHVRCPTVICPLPLVFEILKFQKPLWACLGMPVHTHLTYIINL